MYGKLGKANSVSILATALIVALLVLSGPVLAVVAGVSPDKTHYKSGDNVVFTVYLDIEASEIVPVQNLTLAIKNSSGTAIETCIFLVNGTAVTGCGNLSITPTSTTPYGWGYGNMWGYGYDITDNYNNKSFGYGYGYSHNSSYSYGGVYGAELQYNITWDVSSSDPPDGNYTADLNAHAFNNQNSYIYSSTSATESYFIVDRTAPTVILYSPAATTYYDTAMSLSYNATDNIGLGSVWYVYNGETTIITGNTTFTALSNQESTLVLHVNDTAGNTNSASVTFTVSNPVGTSTGGGGGGAAAEEAPEEEEPSEEPGIEAGLVEEILSTINPEDIGLEGDISSEDVNIEQVTEVSETAEVTESTLTAAESVASTQEAKRALETARKALAEDRQIDVKVSLEVYQVTSKETGQVVHVSRITLSFTAQKDMKDVEIVEIIPKTLASHVSELVFHGKQPLILQEDPIVEWTFPLVMEGETREMGYTVKKKLDSVESATIALAGELLLPCTENWKCTGWSECIDGRQTRECTDMNACGTEHAKPGEIQACITPTIPLGMTFLVFAAFALIIILMAFVKFIHLPSRRRV